MPRTPQDNGLVNALNPQRMGSSHLMVTGFSMLFTDIVHVIGLVLQPPFPYPKNDQTQLFTWFKLRESCHCLYFIYFEHMGYLKGKIKSIYP